MTAIMIRKESPGEEMAIERLIHSAFSGLPYSDGTESDIVRKLREEQALELSLVAYESQDLLGYLCFSRVDIQGEFSGYYGLGPVGVKPGAQKKGIGSKSLTILLSTETDLERQSLGIRE